MVGQGLDPVEAGLVESLARPGGNVTGITNLTTELGGKRLELFKEAVPKLVRVAVLYDPAIPRSVLEAKEFEAAKRAGAQAILAHPSTFIVTNRARIIELGVKHRLPVIYSGAEHAAAGGLMSYGPDIADNFQRAAVYIDKILKGTTPSALPVQQPIKFEFVINLKAAKQIGLTIPPNVLARADRVIR
jgi:putative ABC transport system substrate-binding protein